MLITSEDNVCLSFQNKMCLSVMLQWSIRKQKQAWDKPLISFSLGLHPTSLFSQELCLPLLCATTTLYPPTHHHPLPFCCPISVSFPNISHFKDTANSSMGIFMMISNRKGEFSVALNEWPEHFGDKEPVNWIRPPRSKQLQHRCAIMFHADLCGSQLRGQRMEDSWLGSGWFWGR